MAIPLLVVVKLSDAPMRELPEIGGRVAGNTREDRDEGGSRETMARRRYAVGSTATEL
jgi:hypothetical protein